MYQQNHNLLSVNGLCYERFPQDIHQKWQCNSLVYYTVVDPNPDQCSKILREIVEFERNAIYRQYQGYIAV